MKLKDTYMEIEAESTNNEDQLLNKVILLVNHVIWNIKWFGLDQSFRK